MAKDPQTPPYIWDIGPTNAIRGFLINPEKFTGLRFGINPSRIEHEKTPIYEYETQEGWPFPLIHWKAGGAYRIRFDLFSDQTNDAVSNGILSFLAPLFGTQGVKAVLESFMAPQKQLGLEVPIDNPFADPPPRRMYPPPDCYLLLGLRFWRTKLVQAPLEEVLFDKMLTPVRMLSKLEFVVIEEGTLNDMNHLQSSIFANIEAAQGVAEAIGDLVSLF